MPRRTSLRTHLPGRETRVGRIARLDTGRRARTGAPEVILGEGKDESHLLAILRTLAAAGRAAVVSRPTGAQSRALRRAARAKELPLQSLAGGRVWRLHGSPDGPPPVGVVGLVTAGTADVPVAEEARAVLASVGAETVEAYDVGVAGLHRVTRAVRQLERARPKVYLVFAGREGALPTVWAGLVRAPVVGIPTSVGYGRGGRGEAALNAMLQSCAPVAVVNIDGGVPAALFALQLLAGSRRAD
ncbi:MAG TPA: nickel pincer cofactor biosynthesis protein LarB [Thermoplasmata archaeon]|nr:nickel pincer cofactor biosynthesis protein LarB [Thermoplasmata archaeon]